MALEINSINESPFNIATESQEICRNSIEQTQRSLDMLEKLIERTEKFCDVIADCIEETKVIHEQWKADSLIEKCEENKDIEMILIDSRRESENKLSMCTRFMRWIQNFFGFNR